MPDWKILTYACNFSCSQVLLGREKSYISKEWEYRAKALAFHVFGSARHGKFSIQK